jgi:gliding motility-associated-like protein
LIPKFNSYILALLFYIVSGSLWAQSYKHKFNFENEPLFSDQFSVNLSPLGFIHFQAGGDYDFKVHQFSFTGSGNSSKFLRNGICNPVVPILKISASNSNHFILDTIDVRPYSNCIFQTLQTNVTLNLKGFIGITQVIDTNITISPSNAINNGFVTLVKPLANTSITMFTLTSLNSNTRLIDIDDFSIEYLPVAIDTLSFINSSCQNQSTVYAALKNGTPPYTYNWYDSNNQLIQTTTKNSITDSLFNAPNGTVIYNIYDNLNWGISGSIFIPNASVVVNSNIAPSCGTDSNGSIALSPTGVLSSSYSWSNSATTPLITNLSNGTYYVSVYTISPTCTFNLSYSVDSFNFEIEELNPIVVLEEGFEGNTFPPIGWSTILESGSSNWQNSSNKANSGSKSAFSQFNWSVGKKWLISPIIQVKNGDILDFYTSKEFSSNWIPDSLYVKISSGGSNIVDFDTTIFAMDVNSTTLNNFSKHSLDLSAFQNTSIRIAFYHFNEDGNGVYIDDVSIIRTDILPLNCNTGDTVLTAKPTTGNAFTYAWSTGSSTDTIHVNSAGNYTVTVTHTPNSCSKSKVIEVFSPPSLDFDTIELKNVSCNGYSDGSITIHVTSGTPGYSFLWSNGDTTAKTENLSVGTYSVTVSDYAGCSVSKSYVISQPSVLQLNVDSNYLNACGRTLQFSATGGTAPFTFTWPDASQGNRKENLGTGTYDVTVNDANNCIDNKSINFTVTNNFSVSIIDSSASFTCSYDTVGKLYALVNSVGSYTNSYIWSNSNTDSIINNIPGGNYKVTVSNSFGCVDSASYTISSPNELNIFKFIDAESCYGENDGYASVNWVNHAQNPLTYNWSNSQTSSSISNLSPGTYFITVTDANNCTKVDSVVIESAKNFNLTIDSIQNISCPNSEDGFVSISYLDSFFISEVEILKNNDTTRLCLFHSSSNYLNYDFQCSFNNQANDIVDEANNYGCDCDSVLISTSLDLSNLDTGTYTVFFKFFLENYDYYNNNYCQDTLTFQLTAPQSISMSSFNTNQVSCVGGNDGAITISFTGGTPPYNVVWNNGAYTGTNLTNLVAGTYVYSVTDSNNCSPLVDSITLLTIDNTPPTILALDTVVLYLNASGNATLDTSMFDNGSFDNCTLASFSLSKINFNCADTGFTSVTYTLTDISSNSSNKTIYVQILDTNFPNAVAKNINAYLSRSGHVYVSANMVNDSSNAACGINKIWLSKNQFDCSNTGTNNVYLYAQDNKNNVDSALAIITVIDTFPPQIWNGNVVFDVDFFNDTIFSDYLYSTTVNQIDFRTSGVVYTGVPADLFSARYRARFIAPATGVYTFELRHDDGVRFYINNILKVNSWILTSQAFQTTTHNLVKGEVVEILLEYFEEFQVADLRLRWSSTAAGIPSLQVMNSITVPTSCNNQTVTLDSNGTGSIPLSNFSNLLLLDNCGIDSSWVFPSVFTCNNIGNTTGSYFFTNTNGDTNSCTFNVTVTDTTKPTLIYNDSLLVYLNGASQATINAGMVNISSYDSCGIDTMYLSQNTFNCSHIGFNSVQFTATDVNGNSSSANVWIQVLDTNTPTVFTKNINAYLNANGWVTITPNDVDSGSYANCVSFSLALDIDSFTCANLGANTVTLTLTDSLNNTAQGTATVTVLDTVAPQVLTQNISVYLNSNGQANINTAQINYGSIDNCTIDSLWLSDTLFTCADTGANVITLWARDASNNTSSASATVTVFDTIAPVLITKNDTVYLDNNGLASITPANVNNGTVDSCGIDSLWLSVNSFTCADTGTFVVKLYASDFNGNVDSANAWITLLDTLAPQVFTQNITTYLDSNGQASINVALINNNSIDNCAIDSLWLSNSLFSCADTGLNTVNLWARDVSGNISSALATVNVLDTIAPAVFTKNDTVYLGLSSQAIITPALIDSNSSDNCGIASLSLSQDTFTCAHIGVNTVWLTATDSSGNSSTASALVTVLDTNTPTVFTKNINAYLNANGWVTITPNDVDSGSFANCVSFNLALDVDSFTCANLGANTVTLTLTDSLNNTAQDTAIVTVLDTLAPTVIARNITVYLDSAGNANITPALADSATFDNCAVDSLWLSASSFDCSNLGTNSILLYANDSSGNVGIDTFVVNVVDSLAPQIQTQNLSVYLDSNGVANINSASLNNGSTDNCGVDSIWASQNNFNCSHLGANNVLLYASDASNNTASDTALITIIDTIKPILHLRIITVQLDSAGQASISASMIDSASLDNCSIDSIWLNTSTFNCGNIGVNTVIFYAIDISGNTQSDSVIVTVNDNQAPTLIARNITVYLDSNGSASITPALVDSASFDNCAIDSLWLSDTLFTCADTGANVITLWARDASNNTSSASATVTVFDTIAPVLITKNDTVYLDNNGLASITPANVNNGTVDSCGIDSLWLSVNSFTCADTGTFVVKLYASDFNGNVDSANAWITLLDTLAPQVFTQNITTYLDSNGQASINVALINNNSIDNCAIDSLWLSNSLFSCVDTGLNTVNLWARDVSGNISSALATVNVLDTIAPAVFTKNDTVYLGLSSQAIITPALIDSNSSDNCGIASLSLSQDTFTCAHIGVNTVWLTATDSSGNSSTASALVTVLDTNTPTVFTKNINAYLNANGWVTITPNDVDSGSFANCVSFNLALDVDSFTCANLGANTVTLTLTDSLNNTAQDTAIVTVLDTLAPTVIARNITVYLDSAGNANITPALADSATFDNCAVDSLWLSASSFDCSNLGTNSILLYANDSSGNVGVDSFVVTVVDTLAPQIQTQNLSVYLDSNGVANINSASLNNGSTDNCGVDSIWASQNNFNCSHLGANNVLLYASDASNNTASDTALITIIDTIKPILHLRNITVQLDSAGQASISASMIDSASLDNCSIDSIWLNTSTFNCGNIGVNTVIFYAIDISGNTQSDSVIVTVNDNQAPTLIARNITVYLDSNGSASITPALVDSASFDNCAIDSLWLSDTLFTCADTGANVITLWARDASNNTSSASATVTVFDTIAPVLITKNDTVYLDNNGLASITPANVNNGTVDSCGIDSLWLSVNSFTCADTGTFVVKLYASDFNGNVDSANAWITLLDTLAPQVFTQNITTYLDSNGQASINVALINNNSIDNCAIDSLWLSNSLFSCADTGLNTVNLWARDVSGNISSALATVNVLDTIAPAVFTKNDTVYLGLSSQAIITPALIDSNSSDNCGIASLSLSQDTFTCAHIGVNTVWLTATDSSGNSSTASALVTVLDTNTPTVFTKNINAYLNANGWVTITPNDVDSGSFANCVSFNLALDVDSFTCANLGANTVTLTLTDSLNNTAQDTAIVTVLDTLAPTVIARNITVYLDSNGNANITPALADSATFDNCAVDSLWLSTSNFDCSNLGVNSIVLYANDSSGNVGIDTFVVNVVDTLAPVVQVRNDTLYLDSNGVALLTVSQVDSNSFDNCGIDSLWLSQTTFTCADLGNNTITLFASDSSGNLDSAFASIFVIDTLAPILIVQNLTVYLDSNGNASITTSMVDSATTDNCAIDSLWLNKTNFDCSDIGVDTIWFYATDLSNNIDSTQVWITVLDTLFPSAIAQNRAVYLDSNGLASITAVEVNNNSLDNCGIDTMWLSLDTFSCADTGVISVMLFVQDFNGNIDSASAAVSVFDTIRPSVHPKNLVLYLDSNGLASLNATQLDSATFDNCGLDSIWINQTSFSCADTGTLQINLFATDVNGNTDSAQANITLLDTLAPTIFTQNVSVYLDASGNASISVAMIDNGTTDNCALDTLWLSDTVFSCSDTGLQTINLYALDESGNMDSATATITVFDTLSPIVITRNITAYLDSNGQVVITPALVDSASFDNCAIASMVLSQDTFNCNAVGVNTVWLTLSDSSGNTASDSALITILDTLAPTIHLFSSYTAYLDLNGIATILATNIDSASFDNCNIDSIFLSDTMFTCADLGERRILFSATDSSGNITSDSVSIFIIDSINPQAFARNIIVYLDSNGLISVTPQMADSASSDNCSIDSMFISLSDFTCNDIGFNSVVLTVLDASGNVDSTTFVVEVRDTLAPEFTLPVVTLYLDSAGEAHLNLNSLNLALFDNCGIDTLILSDSLFNCSDIGISNVIVTAIDASGNTNQDTLAVTILDTISPTVIGKRDIVVYLDSNGLARLNLSDVDSIAFDNCSIFQLELSDTLIDCSYLSTPFIYLNAIDNNGNQTTDTINISVLDTFAPSLICIDTIASCNPIVFFDAPNALDNCAAIVAQTDGLRSGSVFEVGNNFIVYEAQDLTGNSVRCTTNVFIHPKPVISLPTSVNVFYLTEYKLPLIDDLGVRFEWFPPTYLDNPKSKNPISTPEVDITYYVRSISDEGCESDEASISLNILKREVKVPTGFSPDNDGINDFFEIPGIAKYPDCSVIIYNRSGEVVFESKGYNTPWDGTFNGQALPIASYYYFIDFGDGSDVQTGIISIIR